jgi:hypothetical protein
MIRLDTRRLTQKTFDNVKTQGEVHVINVSVRRDIGHRVETCVQLLFRGVSIVEVAKLSGLPENTLSHLVRAREIPIRRAGRGPKNLDLVLRDPLSHLQISAFLVSVQLQKQIIAQHELDAETYLAAMRRVEKSGLSMAVESLPYVSLAIEMWIDGSLDLSACRSCAGVHLRVRQGTNYSIRQSSRCPFCAMVERIREGNQTMSVESVDLGVVAPPKPVHRNNAVTESDKPAPRIRIESPTAVLEPAG